MNYASLYFNKLCFTIFLWIIPHYIFMNYASLYFNELYLTTFLWIMPHYIFINYASYIHNWTEVQNVLRVHLNYILCKFRILFCCVLLIFSSRWLPDLLGCHSFKLFLLIFCTNFSKPPSVVLSPLISTLPYFHSDNIKWNVQTWILLINIFFLFSCTFSS
jgi:hypothetical protein